MKTKKGKIEGPTREETEKIAEAVSEASERLIPGFPGVTYREKLFRSGARECLLLLASGGGGEDSLTPLREADEDPKEARLRLLRGLADLGRPEAGSAAEMRLKLAAAGDGAFEGVCRRYGEYDPPEEERRAAPWTP